MPRPPATPQYPHPQSKPTLSALRDGDIHDDPARGGFLRIQFGGCSFTCSARAPGTLFAAMVALLGAHLQQAYERIVNVAAATTGETM